MNTRYFLCATAEGAPVIEIRVLGPVEVWRDNLPVRLERRQQRSLLGLLALELGESITADRLIETLWRAAPPSRARSILHTRLSELRSALAAAAGADDSIQVESLGNAYRLLAPPQTVDASVFLDAAKEWRNAPSIDDACDVLHNALNLWRGPLLGGIPLNAFATAGDNIAAARLTALEDLFSLELHLGRHSHLVDEIAELSGVNPSRERLLGLAMLAMYRAGRAAEALSIYSGWRERLRTELGVDPGTTVQQIYLAILRNDDLELMLASPLITEPIKHFLQAPTTQASRPAMKFVANIPRTMPHTIADFTGRNSEVSDLLAMLRSGGAGQPIAISGPGGVGKTALSIAVANLARHEFPDGQLFADLHGSEGDQALSAYDALGRFLRALGVDGSAAPGSLDERVDLYKTILADRRILIVLDNVTSDDQISALLPGGPSCRMIVNSRPRLGKTVGAYSIELTLMPESDAITLLELLIGSHRVKGERRSASDLVRQCGHLPLAIRIAGAKLATKPHWTIARLVSMLRDEHQRLSGLTHGQLDVRASIALSYDGLTEGTQRLLQLLGRLGLPDFSSWLASAVLDSGCAEAERFLEELFDAQLVDAIGQDATGHVRYKLHDLVRLFAWETAEHAISASDIRQSRARAYGAYLFVTEAAYRKVQGGDYQAIRGAAVRWPVDEAVTEALVAQPLLWFESEHRSLIAMVHSAAADEMLDACWELAFASSRLFQMRRYFDDWQRMIKFVRDKLSSTDSRLGQATVHLLLGWIFIDRADYAAARRYCQIASALFATLGNRFGTATVEVYLGNIARYTGDVPTALEHYQRSHAFFASADDRGALAFVLRELGQAYLQQEDYAQARDHLGSALAIYKEIQAAQGTAQLLFWTGMLALRTGQPDDARDGFQEALGLVRQINDRAGEVQCLRGLGLADRALGDVEAARAKLNEALQLARQPGPTQLESLILESLAELEQARPPL